MSYKHSSSFSSFSNVNDQDFMQAMEDDIINADIPEFEREKLMKNFLLLKRKKVNLMITGATGSGKSSTINALFGLERAKVGVGVDPETMDIQKYDLGNLVLWDTPGLGDGKEADDRHARNIIDKLYEKDSEGELLIDLVLVILDGSTRDLGTSYDLINRVIIPNLGENPERRILVAINQADVAMKGRYWDYENNCPEPELEKFLGEKVESVRKRIKEGTGVDVKPIFYSAGFKDGDKQQNRPYNLTKLLYYIIHNTPKEKRLAYMDNVNREQDMWRDNDHTKYGEKIKSDFFETLSGCVTTGVDIGGKIGGVFGSAGRVAGSVLGGVVGGAVGIVRGLFDLF